MTSSTCHGSFIIGESRQGRSREHQQPPTKFKRILLPLLRIIWSIASSRQGLSHIAILLDKLETSLHGSVGPFRQLLPRFRSSYRRGTELICYAHASIAFWIPCCSIRAYARFCSLITIVSTLPLSATLKALGTYRGYAWSVFAAPSTGRRSITLLHTKPKAKF